MFVSKMKSPSFSYGMREILYRMREILNWIWLLSLNTTGPNTLASVNGQYIIKTYNAFTS